MKGRDSWFFFNSVGFFFRKINDGNLVGTVSRARLLGVLGDCRSSFDSAVVGQEKSRATTRRGAETVDSAGS